jgi:hypothetical protein
MNWQWPCLSGCTTATTIEGKLTNRIAISVSQEIARCDEINSPVVRLKRGIKGDQASGCLALLFIR